MLNSTTFDELAAEMTGLKYVEIYLNERLYDLFAGLPYKYVSINGELNYRLRVMYNKKILFLGMFYLKMLSQ